MKVFGFLGAIIAFALLITAFNSFYIVDQRDQALVLQVGRAVDVVNANDEDDAGLKYKLPFVQNVVTLDKRNMGLDIPDIEVIAADQEQLLVDAFVRWRIEKPLEFYRRLTNERNARLQLARFTNAAIRDVLGKQLPEDIISGQRSVLMDEIRTRLTADAADLGIQIVDVRIRRADLPSEVSERVFERMRTAREQEAERIRAEGDEAAAKIKATAERNRTVILAEAREKSEIIKGEGDAKRNEIYNDAYGQDLDFFNFYRGLIACEAAFPEGARIVVSPDQLNLCEDILESARRGVPSRR